jgi:ubiquinone/menaquinone biosynthesis C-methylase UbiE
MDRRPEREVMDDEAQAEAYARADFSASNRSFAEAVARLVTPGTRRVLDLGCGPGDATVVVARTLPETIIVAVDASRPMLDLARDAVRAAGLSRRIAIACGRIPALPFGAAAFDALLSKDLLHHLPDPLVLWSEVSRLGRPGALVCVMDLARPDSPDAARRIVDRVAGRESPVLQEDFYNSLCAAFRPDEVRAQLVSAGLELVVEPAGERHLLVRGHLPG